MANSKFELLQKTKVEHLEEALDFSAMPDRFTDYFRSLGLPPGWRIESCAVEKTYYRHPKRCGLLYRLHFRDDSGNRAEEWAYSQLFRPGKGKKYAAAPGSTLDGYQPVQPFLSEVPPFTTWEEMDMAIWLFPMDPYLISLRHIVDAEDSRKRLQAHLAVLCLNGRWPQDRPMRVREVSCQRLKYMPRKRCVLRYRAEVADANGRLERLSVISKTSKQANGRYYFELLRSTRAQLTAQSAEVIIPAPLIYFDETSTMWQEDWHGSPLVDVFEDFEAQELFTKIATSVANFHLSELDGLPAGPGPDAVLDAAERDGRALSGYLPHFKPLVDAVLQKLRAARPKLADRTPAVPIHGACRLQQMLSKDTEIALIDFDALALGDPLYDVGEFLASLLFLEFSHGKKRAVLEQASQAFRQAYCERVSWQCSQKRLAWYVLAFSLTKAHSLVKSLQLAALDRFDRDGERFMLGWLESL